jgi:hypothetical protein
MPANGEFHNEETSLVPVAVPPPDALSIQRAPEIVLEEAQRAAAAIAKVIEAKPRKVQFNGKTYLQFEDWQTLGRFYGVTAVARSTKFVEFGDDEYAIRGFEATSDALLVSTGQIISSAEALCLSDESNWSSKPLFQLKSMAQTRACAKALRNVLAWVVVLAGYAPTPAEEMESETVSSPHVSSPRRKSQTIIEPARISEAQQKRLFAMAREHDVDKDQVRSIIERHGFEFSREITKDKYKLICAEIEGK